MTDMLVNEQVECDCGEHHLRVRAWRHWPLLEVAVLASASCMHWRSFWGRLSLAWGLLWNGAVAVHDVLLHPDSARALADMLKAAADAAEKEDK